MRPRISIRGCVRPTVRRSVRPSVRRSVRRSVGPSHTSWIFEKWAKFEQNSIRNKKVRGQFARERICCPNSVRLVVLFFGGFFSFSVILLIFFLFFLSYSTSLPFLSRNRYGSLSWDLWPSRINYCIGDQGTGLSWLGLSLGGSN